MEYKTILDDEQKVVGIAVNEKGLPIMVSEGVETGIDAIHLLGKVPSLQEEAKGHRLKAKEVQDELDEFKTKFSGIEDPTKALEALTKMQDIDGQKLIDANDAETLRKQLQSAHDKEVENLKGTFEIKSKEYGETLNTMQADLFDALVLQKFNSSPLFSGENPKTFLFPEVAKDHFGKNFKVEKDSAGKSTVIGYHMTGENAGQKIFSMERPGEIAGFDEAMSIIIDLHPQKDHILKTSHGGGAGGSEGGGSLNKLDKMKKELVEARKVKDTMTANRLIRQISEEENK